MEKIRKLSQIILVILKILLITIPIIHLVTWVFIDSSFIKSIVAKGILLTPLETPEKMVNLAQINWTMESKLIAIIANILHTIPLLLGIYSLKIIFTNYSKGKIFIQDNAKQYKKLGIVILAHGIFIKIIYRTMMVLAVTLSNPAGQRYIVIGFGTPNLETILCGTIIIVISWIMLEANKINSEYDLTI